MVKTALERLDQANNPERDVERTGKPGMELIFSFSDYQVTSIEWQPRSSHLDEKVQHLIDFHLDQRVGGW